MKYTNFIIFIISLSVLIFLQSYTHVSTSLLAILPEGESKEMIRTFNNTQNAKVLLLAVKGFDARALEQIERLEKELTVFTNIDQKQMNSNIRLQKHQERYKLFTHKINKDKLSKLDVSLALKKLYTEMTTSFFPVSIDKIDPFKLLYTPEPGQFKLKNAHLILGDYGYLSIFTLNSSMLEGHKKLYQQIHTVVDGDAGIKVFSPLFYYVENTEAITSDVNTIIMMALGILLLLYLLILRNLSLLLNTLTTLATSAIVASIVLTQIYDEVSIFVFVFGISISTIAIDYMFHHYFHGYYQVNDTKKDAYNREVLFGFLTTISAFFILSFTSFLLIKQITIFSLLSLSVSYVHFAFLYPKIRFKMFVAKKNIWSIGLHFLNAKIFFFISAMILIISPFWIQFDLNLKNLDYDNKTLKQTELFFSEKLDSQTSMTFALKAESIDTLISHAQTIQNDIPSARVPLSSLLSRQSYDKNKALLESLSLLKKTLEVEAKKLGFKKGYFIDAYKAKRPFVNYSEEDIKAYGLDLIKVKAGYLTYATVSKKDYPKVLAYDFVESLSLKERFETSMETSMNMLLKLGLLALMVIVLLLYIFTKKAMSHALIFLIFPVAMVSVYAWFADINILHIFMLFIILSIGIDYAIYLSRKNDALTKKAITYSLISTFAGFGVLIFSSVNALFSMGIVATIGIVSILVLLVFLKGVDDVS